MPCGDWKSFLSGMGGDGGENKDREREGKKKVRVGSRAERRREVWGVSGKGCQASE